MEQCSKAYVGKVLEADKGKPIVSLVSTQDVDLAGDIVFQGPNEKGQGWVLDGFNKRGRVYWMHNPFTPNLAKASAKVDALGLILTTEFDLHDPTGALLDHKYREGYLDEWSVGFKVAPGKFEKNEHGGRNFYESILGEVSAVNAGENQHTRVIDKSLTDYVGAVIEAKAMLDEFDQRLRQVEGAIIRMEKAGDEKQAKSLMEAFESLTRARAAV